MKRTTDLLELLADIINQFATIQFIELFKVKEIYLTDTDPCQIQIPLKWNDKMTLCLYITDELATLEYWNKTTGDIDTTQFITNYDLYNGLLNTIENKSYI